MTAGGLSQLFSWIAIGCSILAALSTALALHYRSVSAKEKDAEINRLKPRALSDSQRAGLRIRLAERKGTVGLIYRLMDGEGSDYARDLAATFTDAGWKVASIDGNSLNDFRGYIVGAVSEEKLLPDLNFVRSELIEAGIDCRFEDIQPNKQGPLTADRVWLIVGRKQ
jgi:hypothetical protein